MATKAAAQMVTIYYVGGFGGSTKVGKLVKIADSTKAGQKIVTYVPKGKRKEERVSFPSMVVLDGEHPPVWNGLDDSSTRWGSFDPRYNDHYNMEINAMTAKGATFLVDNRSDADRLVTKVRDVADLD